MPCEREELVTRAEGPEERAGDGVRAAEELRADERGLGANLWGRGGDAVRRAG